MSCKSKAKSLRASNGMELMSRFAKQGKPVLRAESGYTGGHASLFGALGDGLVSAHDTLADGVSALGGMMPSMKTFLPAPSQGASPKRFQTTTDAGGNDHRSQVSYPLPNGQSPTGETPNAQAPALASAPQPAPVGQPVPGMPAMPGYAQHQGSGSGSAPTPAAAPSLRDPGPQQPWRTDTRTLHSSDGAVTGTEQNPMYRSGNSFSDQPNATSRPVSTGTISMQDWSAPGRSNGMPNAQDMNAGNNLAVKQLGRQFTTTGNANDPLSMRTARLADGGEVSPFSVKGIGRSMGFFQTDAEKMATRRADYEKRQAAAAPASAPAPAAAASTPVKAITNYAGGNALDKRMAAAGLRNGGDLRTGQGGDVPGTGTGDKIPALYAPGEFVVSNDMLNAQPQLRQHLRGLREEVLAQKGMTPGQADAKALRYGDENIHHSSTVDSGLRDRGVADKPSHQVGLRAVNGFPDDWVNAPRGGLPEGPAEFTTQAEAANAATRGARAMPSIPANDPFSPQTAQPNAGASTLRAARNSLLGDAGEWGSMGDKAAATGGRALGTLGTGVRQLGKVAKFLAAPVGAYETYQDIQNKDYGSAALHGLDTTAGAALFTPAAPAAGLYLGGRALWEGGKALRNYLDTPTSAPAAPPTGQTAPAQPAAPQDFAAANAAKLAKANAANPELAGGAEAAGKLGETRTYDRGGTLLPEGQEMVFTGPKMGWQQRTSEEGKAKANALRSQYAEDADFNASRSRADDARQLAYFDAQSNSGGDKYAGMPIKMAMAARQADAQLAASKLQADTTMGATRLNNANALRTTEMNNETQLMGNRMSNRFAGYKFGIEQANNQRDYDRNVANDKNAQQVAGEKAFTDHALSLFQTKDGKGNVVPDTQKAAAYTASVTDTIGHIIKQYANSNNPQERAYAARLNSLGPAGLDAADRAALPQLFERQQLHAATESSSPFASSGGQSRNLLDYADKDGKAETSTGWQQRRTLRGGQEIPESNLRYGAGANHFLPNWGSGSNYLGAK